MSKKSLHSEIFIKIKFAGASLAAIVYIRAFTTDFVKEEKKITLLVSAKYHNEKVKEEK